MKVSARVVYLSSTEPKRRSVVVELAGAGGDAKQPVENVVLSVRLNAAGAARLCRELAYAAGLRVVRGT